MPTEILIDGRGLTVGAVEAVARHGAKVALCPDARERMLQSRALVDEVARAEGYVYGINTGFGALAEVRIADDALRALQRNLIVSHAAGVGRPLARDSVRAMMLLRAQVMATGHSGVRPVLVERLVQMLNRGVHPVIPEKGSVGASGDLAPLAHLALVVCGLGSAELDGETMPGGEAMQRAEIAAVELRAKEGLCLVNGTQASLAVGLMALLDAERVARSADVCGAMSLEGYKGTPKAFDPKLVGARPQPGAAQVAAGLRRMLEDSEIVESHRLCGRVQDPYSFRCMPQVHGATRDVLAHVREVLGNELNAATDNPLVFSDEREIISGGNFHGQPLALALDYACMAMSEIANIAERRIEQLVNPQLGGLKAFLSPEPGLNSGYMMAQVTAASLINECKVLAHPASIDSIPSSANREDHVSMSMTSARKARDILQNVSCVLGIEALCGAQALDFHAPLKPGRGVMAAWAALRACVPPLTVDREVHEDIAAASELLHGGGLLQAAEAVVGEL